MITIWIKTKLLPQVNENNFVPASSEYAVGKYPAWANGPNDFAQVSIPLETFNRWKNGGVQLLKG